MHAQQYHVAGAEGFAVVTHRFQSLLLFIQLRLQGRFFIFREPFGLGRFVFHQHPPAEGPDNGRHTFNNEHLTPAEGLDQISGDHRHPQYRDRVAENKEGIGARAFGFGKPVADVDQHRGHDRRLHYAKNKTNGRQRRDVIHHPGEGGAGTPEDQADEDQFADAAAFGIDGARDLEKEVTEEEEGPQQRGDAFGDPQVFRNACGRREAKVRTIKVRQAVRDKHDRHDVPPAFYCVCCIVHRLASVVEGVTAVVCRVHGGLIVSPLSPVGRGKLCVQLRPGG